MILQCRLSDFLAPPPVTDTGDFLPNIIIQFVLGRWLHNLGSLWLKTWQLFSPFSGKVHSNLSLQSDCPWYLDIHFLTHQCLMGGFGCPSPDIYIIIVRSGVAIWERDRKSMSRYYRKCHSAHWGSLNFSKCGTLWDMWFFALEQLWFSESILWL